MNTEVRDESRGSSSSRAIEYQQQPKSNWLPSDNSTGSAKRAFADTSSAFVDTSSASVDMSSASADTSLTGKVLSIGSIGSSGSTGRYIYPNSPPTRQRSSISGDHGGWIAADYTQEAELTEATTTLALVEELEALEAEMLIEIDSATNTWGSYCAVYSG
jgi:hypothetical protein